jgi:hypothetical protein
MAGPHGLLLLGVIYANILRKVRLASRSHKAVSKVIQGLRSLLESDVSFGRQ